METASIKYKTVFSNRKGIVNTELEDLTKNSSEFFFPITIDGVTIETDGFDGLSIDKPEQYSENQLSRFDYNVNYPYKDKSKKLLVLTNYHLETLIPIFIREIKSGKRRKVDIHIEMEHDGKRVTRRCCLLDKESENFDMECAFVEMQEQLKEYCQMEICSNCRNSFWNPYGGNEFFNQLCFKSESEKFQSLKDKDRMTVMHFMKFGEDKNFENVQLTDFCKAFEHR